MLSTEDNEYVSHVGPGTPVGNVFRRFWLPALVPSEIPHPDSDPIRLRLPGEDLVAFRDANRHVGIILNNCPHLHAEHEDAPDIAAASLAQI